MTWLGAFRFGAPSHGGILLFVFGFLMSAFGLALAAAPPAGDIDIGPLLGPVLIFYGLPPLFFGVAILRHHRWAQLAGILVGSLYGAMLLSLALAGSLVPAILGVTLLIAAWSLLVAYRTHEV